MTENRFDVNLRFNGRPIRASWSGWRADLATAVLVLVLLGIAAAGVALVFWLAGLEVVVAR